MKIGIAVACHERDRAFLQCLGESLTRALTRTPVTTRVLININKGEKSLKDIKTDIFDYLFEQAGCDVVLNVDADFYLFPHILKHVSSKQACSFAELKRRPTDLLMTLIRLVYPGSWSGCYSLPYHIWQRVKPNFDGTDTSVKRALQGQWKFIRRFCYYDLRPYRAGSVKVSIDRRGLLSRIFYRFSRLQP